MTKEQLNEFSMSEIVYDLKAVLNCLQICMANKVDASIYEGFIPYLCTFVYSGYEYLEKQNIILKTSDKAFKKKIGKVRSKFLKQYATFNNGTYKSLNDFNRNEYIKFFHKKYPNSSPILTREIKNYYIASINDKPIDNYHLSSSILGCEIGSYNDDITPQVQSFIYQMVYFIVQILTAAHKDIGRNTKRVSFDKVKYADINMAYNYENIGVQGNPPILMAFMDILCTVNSYNEIFAKINSNKRIDLKVKYLVLFESIQGIKKIIEFCQESKIDLIIDKTVVEFVKNTDKVCCKNLLRRYCAHYEYKETCWGSDPIVEAFEKHFNKSINEINKDLSLCLEMLANYLNDFVIKVPFSNYE